jgi:hypothetical protein
VGVFTAHWDGGALTHQLFTERELKMEHPPNPLRLARQITAHMIQRKRRARRHLLQAETEDWPEPMLSQAWAAYTEAHNAAECARRIVYHGVDAL